MRKSYQTPSVHTEQLVTGGEASILGIPEGHTRVRQDSEGSGEGKST